MYMSFRWAMFVENEDVICLLCLCMGFDALYVAKELAGPRGKIDDSLSPGTFFVLDRENFVDG